MHCWTIFSRSGLRVRCLPFGHLFQPNRRHQLLGVRGLHRRRLLPCECRIDLLALSCWQLLSPRIRVRVRGLPRGILRRRVRRINRRDVRRMCRGDLLQLAGHARMYAVRCWKIRGGRGGHGVRRMPSRDFRHGRRGSHARRVRRVRRGVVLHRLRRERRVRVHGMRGRHRLHRGGGRRTVPHLSRRHLRPPRAVRHHGMHGVRQRELCAGPRCLCVRRVLRHRRLRGRIRI